MEDENLLRLEQELHALLTDYAETTGYVNINAELHGYDIMQQKRDWDGVPIGIARSIYLRALGIINRLASAMFVETIDRHEQAKKYRTPYNPRTVAIGYILERVDEYASKRNEIAKCYLDDHYTAPEGRKEFIEYKAKGTFGYRSSKLANIEEMEFYDSRLKRRLNVKAGNPTMLATQEKMWGLLNASLKAVGSEFGRRRTKPRTAGLLAMWSCTRRAISTIKVLASWR